MANDSDQSPGTALAPTGQPRPAKVYQPVEDVVPILDTARFEHMQRIATVMAGSSLIPDSLRCTKVGNNDPVPLPAQTVVANCFLIVNQASRWGMDPFAVAGCTSVVHGRLMYEGKLVSAVLEAKLGVQLGYEFGTWVPATETVDLSKEGTGDSLGVRVSAQRAGDPQPVYIEGSVGLWKTTGSNSPWRPGAFKRQLRYRGAREWARAYSPGMMLGVITDDELDVLQERRESAARLSSAGRPALIAGFGDEGDRKPAQEPSGSGGSATPAGGGEAAQRQPEATEQAKPAQGELLDAPEDGQADETTTEEPKHAEAGEVYMIVGEGFSEAGRRKTYKDGFSHSSVGEKGAASLKEYPEHPPVLDPEPEKDGAEAEGSRPTEGTDGAPSAESEPASSDSATDASDDSPAESSGQPQSSEASSGSESEPPPADDGFPGDKPSGEPNPFVATHEKIGAAETWLQIKGHLRELAGTEAYRAAEDEGRRMLRLWAWEAYVELRDSGKETVEPSADITLFRFWLEFAAESEEQITALFRSLSRTEAYAQAQENDKRALGQLVTERKAALAGSAS